MSQQRLAQLQVLIREWIGNVQQAGNPDETALAMARVAMLVWEAEARGCFFAIRHARDNGVLEA